MPSSLAKGISVQAKLRESGFFATQTSLRMTRRASTLFVGAVASAAASLVLLCGICAANDSGAAVNSPTPLGHPPPAEGLEAWINLRVIQKLTHHTSAVIAAVVLFWFVGFIVQHLLHDSVIKRCVLMVDEFVLLCLFVYFAYQLIIFL